MQRLKCKKETGFRLSLSRWEDRAGFTLVETLLAIVIFSMAVIAPLSIASNSLSAATTGKDRMIAIALAREAMEYIRNVRDTNRILYGGDSATWPSKWLDDLNFCVFPNKCVIDTLSTNKDNFKKISYGGGNGVLRIDSDVGRTGLYGVTSGVTCSASSQGAAECWQTSKYTRYAEIEEIVSSREARVKVTVSWRTMFSTKEVVLTEHLLSW